MRRPLIAANWKMNPAPDGWDAKDSPFQPHPDVDVVVFPTFLDLQHCIDAEVNVGAQCGRPEECGAFTGDVSMQMIASAGCLYVLCGHSDRRKFHGETDADVAAQVQAALDADIEPIVCVGETLEEREQGKAKEVVERQVRYVINYLQSNKSSEAAGLAGPAAGGHHKGKREPVREKPLGFSFTLAYEPVWAIGTGRNATPQQAQEMHAFIRSLLPQERKDTIRIIYGGSMNEENAKELLGQPDVDGGLVGGASLNPTAFAAIIRSAIEH